MRIQVLNRNICQDHLKIISATCNISHFAHQSSITYDSHLFNQIVKQNERISTLSKLQKSIHYRNNFETLTSSLSNLCHVVSWNVCERVSLNSSWFVQLFRILHLNQQSHMIFTYLVEIVNLNKRNSKLQKWQKLTHYRNKCKTWKIMLLSNLCLLCANDSTSRNVCNAMMRFSSQFNTHSLDVRYHWLFE